MLGSINEIREFYETLPGQFKIIFYVLSGMAISLPLLMLPHKWMVRIGRTPYLSANWISILRVPFTWVGYLLYFLGYAYEGFCIVCEGFMLDRFDGKVATAGDEENKKDPNFPAPTGKFKEDLNYPGRTPTGKAIDPIGDKLTILIPMIVFAAKGYLNTTPVIVMVCLEVIGSLIRWPFLQLKAFDHLRPYIRGESASWVGKIKVVAQYVALFFGMTLHQKWLEIDAQIILTTLITIDILAAVSIISRLKTNTKFDEVNDEANTAFEHDKE